MQMAIFRHEKPMVSVLQLVKSVTQGNVLGGLALPKRTQNFPTTASTCLHTLAAQNRNADLKGPAL